MAVAFGVQAGKVWRRVWLEFSSPGCPGREMLTSLGNSELAGAELAVEC